MQTTTSRAGSDFAYGYGRVGVLQQQLLHKADVDRLLGSHNDAELHQILADVPFTSVVMPMDNLEGFTVAMEKWLKRELVKLAPEGKGDLFEILWLREDLPVIAHLLKEYHGQTSGLTSPAQSSVTSYPYDMLRAQIFEAGHRELPEDIAHFLEEMKSRKNIRPDQIDHEVAVFISAKQLELAKASGSPLILRYVKHTIDLQNIRTARRVRPGTDTSNLFIEGGEIDPRRLTTNSRELALLIHSSSLPSVVAEGVDGEDSALTLERSLNKGLAHDIAQMRSVPLSVEPIFAYGVMALSQILMIRTVLIGKMAGMSAAEIGTMLPPVFSTSIQES